MDFTLAFACFCVIALIVAVLWLDDEPPSL